MLRNRLIWSCDIDLADREVHAATVANTLCQTVELDRNADSDRLLVVDLVEVDVQRSVGHWVELDVLEDSCVILAVDSHLDDVDVGSVDHLAELAERRRESESYWLAVLVLSLAIEVAGYESFLTEGFRSFLTKDLALLT